MTAPSQRRRAQPAYRDVRKLAQALRAKGYSYALIERELGISYLQARELAAEYDARHGKPRKIVRTARSSVPGSDSTTVPLRDLRNDTSRLLREVEKGRSFLITVSGRVVAELRPASSRSPWVPWHVVESIIREAPLDAQFKADVDAVLDERIDEL
ncbi:MAG TPA: type II toxin-antitoxin system prevent-host-death family antitoxin [Candidatus Dormibacteraeota bacterium]